MHPSAADSIIEWRDPRTLRPHPLNARLYGDEPDDDLRASIAVQGVLLPLLITREGVLISGHRRLKVALALKLETVPVIVLAITDPLEIEEAIIRANLHRAKTRYQLAREYQCLKPIHTELAKRRKLSGNGGVDHRVNCLYGPTEQGRASDLAAAMLGLTGKTADRALQVLQAIDHAREIGYDDDAERLLADLNKSVNRALKSAEQLGYLRSAETEHVLRPARHWREWAAWQWNPITGCMGTCPYCVARAEAEQIPAEFIDLTAPTAVQEHQRLEPFKPRLHEARLSAPLRTPTPEKDEAQCRRVQTCWQGDLFSPGTEPEWVNCVSHVMADTAERRLPWEFLLLTKYPNGLLQYQWPPNVWLGITVNQQEGVAEALTILRALKARARDGVTFLVCAPLRASLHFPSLAACDYLFIASQFRTPTCPEYVPPQAEWILALIARAAVDHCAVHIDPALIARWPVGNNLTAILHSAMAPVLEKIGK